MTTPWIDTHAHYSLPSTPESRHDLWQAMQAADFVLPEPFHWTVDGTLDFMDRTGISMQILSNIPRELDLLKDSNDYGASLVSDHPARFGLLAALPTDNVDDALAEVQRAGHELRSDGFAVSCVYNGVYLGDPSLDPLWVQLEQSGAAVFVHPFAYAPSARGLPAPLIEVAFETARCVVDMLYRGVFRRHPSIKFVIAHGGGALPALTGRLIALGTEPWVPNAIGLDPDEIRTTLAGLYLDTAMSASPSSLEPALETVGVDHIVYGSDWGVPCSTETTVAGNRNALKSFPGLSEAQHAAIARRAFDLYPAAEARWSSRN